MKKSRNGQWTLDDEKYQYLIDVSTATFVKVKRYTYGFNSITVITENYNRVGETENTWPRGFFYKVVKSSAEDAMVEILQRYNKSAPLPQEISQRLYEYRQHLNKNYPEKLI